MTTTLAYLNERCGHEMSDRSQCSLDPSKVAKFHRAKLPNNVIARGQTLENASFRDRLVSSLGAPKSRFIRRRGALRGTMAYVLSDEKRLAVLAALCDGNSIRVVEVLLRYTLTHSHNVQKDKAIASTRTDRAQPLPCEHHCAAESCTRDGMPHSMPSLPLACAQCHVPYT